MSVACGGSAHISAPATTALRRVWGWGWGSGWGWGCGAFRATRAPRARFCAAVLGSAPATEAAAVLRKAISGWRDEVAGRQHVRVQRAWPTAVEFDRSDAAGFPVYSQLCCMRASQRESHPIPPERAGGRCDRPSSAVTPECDAHAWTIARRSSEQSAGSYALRRGQGRAADLLGCAETHGDDTGSRACMPLRPSRCAQRTEMRHVMVTALSCTRALSSSAVPGQWSMTSVRSGLGCDS